MPAPDIAKWGTGPAFMLKAPEEIGRDAADQQRHREKMIAQAKAENLLADLQMPPDLREFAERMGVPELANLVWTNGFLTGWRLAGRSVEETSDD